MLWTPLSVTCRPLRFFGTPSVAGAPTANVGVDAVDVTPSGEPTAGTFLHPMLANATAMAIHHLPMSSLQLVREFIGLTHQSSYLQRSAECWRGLNRCSIRGPFWGTRRDAGQFPSCEPSAPLRLKKWRAMPIETSAMEGR